MRYVLLLRGVNMMGKNSLIMSDFIKSLSSINEDGLSLLNIEYYINSGNVFFDSQMKIDRLYFWISNCLKVEFNLTVDFVLLTAEQLLEEQKELPAFWYDDRLKRQVLFYMPKFDLDGFGKQLKTWQIDDEHIYMGKTALFWAGNQDNSTYHHRLITAKWLKQLSIRNQKTFEKLFEFL